MKKGWEIKLLGEVCNVLNGGTPKTGVGEFWNGPHRWITPAEMGKRDTPYVGETERMLTDAGLSNSSARLLPPHSVILSSRAPIGHLVINTEPMAFNQGCKGLVPRDGLNHKFLYHYLRSIVELLDSLGTGATFRELSGGKLKEVTIPVPPLAEQQRIVGLLDEAFAGLATAQANAEKNLQNARALFASHLQSVFSQRGEGWVETTVGELVQQGVIEAPIDGNHGEIHPKKADFVEAGVPFLMASDLKNGAVDQENCNFITQKQADSLRKGFAKDGDVLISHKGTIGRVAILRTNLEYVVLTPQVTYYRISKPTVLSNHFLFYALQAEEFVSAINEIAGAGSTRAYIGITKQHELPLVFPPLDHQRRIASQLDALAAETQRLEALYQQKLAALAALKKSLLYQAFTGMI